MSLKKGFGNSDSYIGYETVIQPNNKIKQGQIHPEIGKIREKFLRKDLKLFKKFAVSHFCRPCYENEKDTYPDEAFKHLENGKDDCDSMACFLIDSETRVALPQNSKKIKGV